MLELAAHEAMELHSIGLCKQAHRLMWGLAVHDKVFRLKFLCGMAVKLRRPYFHGLLALTIFTPLGQLNIAINRT